MPLQIRRGTDAERQGSFTPAEGELIYTTDTKKLYVGDGITPGGVAIDTVGSGGITDIVSDTTPQLGGNLDLLGNDITGNGNINISGNVSATQFNGALVGDITGNTAGIHTGNVVGNVTGNLTGNVVGDTVGSVFSDNSTLVINGLDSSIHTATIHARSNNIDIFGDTAATPLDLNFYSDAAEPGRVNFTRKDLTVDLSLDTISNGRITFGREDINGAIVTSFINGRNDCLFLFADSTGNAGDVASYITFKDKKLGIGTVTPSEELDVQGNAVVTGFVQFGSLTTAERDALTAVNGMVIYNTTDNKFQGRENGVWVNLV